MINKAISYDGDTRHSITKRLLPEAVRCSGLEFGIDSNAAGSADGGRSVETMLFPLITFIKPSKRFIDRDPTYGEFR